MKNRYFDALFTSLLSIGPIILLVCILSWTPILNFGTNDYVMLLFGGVALILGLALFQIGASAGLTKVGEYMGSSLSRQKQLFVIIIFSFALGVLITCAEPSLLIVSKQVTIVPNNEVLNTIILIGSIAIGVGAFVVIGILRIILHKPLKLWVMFFYLITFLLVCLVALNPERAEMLPFIFDSGGVTTGSATVPFVLSLGLGVAVVRGGKTANSDSFGLAGLVAIGPVIAMAVCVLIQSNVPEFIYEAPTPFGNDFLGRLFTAMIPNNGQLGSMIEVLIAISPILIVFFVYELIFIKLPISKMLSLLVGFGFCFVGLSFFLASANAIMGPIGGMVGQSLGGFWQSDQWIVILVAFTIGLVTILCEPAVHVLTAQIENISSGQIKKSTVLIALSLAVGSAIMLAAIRSIYDFSILYYLVPGYIISLTLMLFSPDIFAAIAIDSGSTAAGPMAVSFIMPLIIGLYSIISSDKLSLDSAYHVSFYGQAFGAVALITLMPVISIQLLGIVVEVKQYHRLAMARKAIVEHDDVQIIHFNKGV